MDSRESQERLLDDVLGPVPVVGLEAGLAEMRRLRTRRRLVRALACAACLAVAAVCLRERESPPAPPAPPEPAPAYVLRSRPLRPSQIVVSQGALVERVPARQTEVARVVLATAPGSEEIVFLDPSDRDRFLGPSER